jgi:hypothetical protein
MALTGTELVRVVGNVDSITTPSSQSKLVTTQNIANLNTGGTGVPSAPLVGDEAVLVQGIRPDGMATANQFFTTTGAIAALGSIAPSTLTGKEIMELFNVLSNATVPAGPARYVTTALVAG